ncbi:hypothetical protein LY76DRAFT_605713 [Colletotrichum caudatum]|nr:hypothetical protein LY76DRAFT_605713 [Colletotrichum caudatum]
MVRLLHTELGGSADTVLQVFLRQLHLDTIRISLAFSQVTWDNQQASKEFRENRQPWEDSSVSAQECALYFCTNIYQSDIVQGNLRETILGTYTHRNLDSFLAMDPDQAIESKWYNANTSYSLNYNEMDMNRTDLQLFISKEDYHTSTGLEAEQNLQFNITQNAAGSITGLFMDGLGTSKNLTATFETVAAIISKYIRDLSLETEPNEGEAQNWSREQLREADSMSQMDAHATQHKVRFVDSDLGPELKQSH